MSFAEPLRNSSEEDITASNTRFFLKRAYSQRSKPVTGEVCYQSGLFHEHRAEAAALKVIEGDTLGPIALPELEWADAMRSADACFRDALRQGVPGAFARICKLHQIDPGQRRPIYPGDKVRIYDLVSSFGRRLNQRQGVAISQAESSGRCGVLIDGIGVKYIRPANLIIIDFDEDCKGHCLSGTCYIDNCCVQPDAD